MRLGNVLDKALAVLIYDFWYLFFPPYKRKKVRLLSCSRLLGDVLMVTTVAREIKKRNPEAFVQVEAAMPEIFQNNPDIGAFKPRPSSTTYFQRLFFMVRNGYGFPWKKHLLHYCCKAYGVRGKIDRKVYVYPLQKDVEWAENLCRTFKVPVILISRESSKSHYQEKKKWPAEYWRTLIEKLLRENIVIDVGKETENRFSFKSANWLDLIDETTVHQLAALMKKSSLLISPPSGLVHLASYCDLKTLVIVGGSEPAVATKYPFAESLIDRPVCKDCFIGPPCDWNIQCMKNISAETVYEKTGEILRDSNEK